MAHEGVWLTCTFWVGARGPKTLHFFGGGLVAQERVFVSLLGGGLVPEEGSLCRGFGGGICPKKIFFGCVTEHTEQGTGSVH